MQMRAHRNVLSHRLCSKGLHNLEGAGHAQFGIQVRRLACDVLTLEDHLACVRR